MGKYGFTIHTKLSMYGIYMNSILRKASTYLSQLNPAGYGISSPIGSVVNYLIDSYWLKVDERNSRPDTRDYGPPDPQSHIRETWLGCEIHTCVNINRVYPAVFRDLNAWAIARMFDGGDSQYQIIPFLDTYKYKAALKGHYSFKIQSEQIFISPNEKRTLPIFGLFFVVHRGTGKKLIVSIDLCYESMGCNVSVSVNPADSYVAEQFFSDLQMSIVANDIYFKQCLVYVRGKLDFHEITNTTWDSVIMKSDIKEYIQHNSVGVLENSETLQSLGMCPNQNVILISPPGMAKTTIFRAISNEVKNQVTRIWCTGKSIDTSRDVTSLFEAARGLAPCIIFIEDMDLFGRDRSSNTLGSDPHVLNEFLACLDGTQENSGVVIMASTNDVDSMDEALVNRPGRFDVKVEIPLPDAKDRSDMLKKFMRQYKSVTDESVTQDIWSSIIAMMEGLTGAYVKAVAKSAVIGATSRGHLTDNGRVCVLSASDLTGATQQIMENYAIGKRAKKHHQFTMDVDKKG